MHVFCYKSCYVDDPLDSLCDYVFCSCLLTSSLTAVMAVGLTVVKKVCDARGLAS